MALGLQEIYEKDAALVYHLTREGCTLVMVLQASI